MFERLKAMFTQETPSDIGEIHLSWQFSQFAKEKKTIWWYVGFSFVFALLILYAFLSENYLFAVILVIGGIIVVSQYFRQSSMIDVVIAEDGVIVAEVFYPYKIVDSFYFIYDPPVLKYLYLDLKNGFRKKLPIPLEDVNPLVVRDILLQYVKEDLEKENPEVEELIARFLGMR